jgi:hypothetical protein
VTSAHDRTLKRFHTSDKMYGTAVGVGDTAPSSYESAMYMNQRQCLPYSKKLVEQRSPKLEYERS